MNVNAWAMEDSLCLSPDSPLSGVNAGGDVRNSAECVRRHKIKTRSEIERIVNHRDKESLFGRSRGGWEDVPGENEGNW